MAALLFFGLLSPNYKTMPNQRLPQGPVRELAGLRRQITELVARNAVAMVQNTIDGVNEGGQHQALKYLFEMIGLYPAPSDDDQSDEESLAATLLRHLGIEESKDGLPDESQSSHPVE